jgi:hypothetical protein
VLFKQSTSKQRTDISGACVLLKRLQVHYIKINPYVLQNSFWKQRCQQKFPIADRLPLCYRPPEKPIHSFLPLEAHCWAVWDAGLSVNFRPTSGDKSFPWGHILQHGTNINKVTSLHNSLPNWRAGLLSISVPLPFLGC